MYKHIMVPLDGSKLAECVLPHVEAIAKCGGTQDVTLVRVVEPFRAAAGAEVTFDETYLKKYEAESMKYAENYLDSVAKKISLPGVTIKKVVLSGIPADSLSDYAKNNKVDLIIIATHGRSGVSRWVFGSVADRILRSSQAPVLMVRSPGCTAGA